MLSRYIKKKHFTRRRNSTKYFYFMFMRITFTPDFLSIVITLYTVGVTLPLNHEIRIWFCRCMIKSPGMGTCFVIICFLTKTSRMDTREINHYAELEYSSHYSALQDGSFCLDLDHKEDHWEKLLMNLKKAANREPIKDAARKRNW